MASHVNGTFLPKYQKIALHKVVITAEALEMAMSKGNEIRKLFEDMILVDEYISEKHWKDTFNYQDLCQKRLWLFQMNQIQ